MSKIEKERNPSRKTESSRVRLLALRLKELFNSEPEYLLSQDDVRRLCRLSDDTTSEKLIELFVQVKRNRRISAIIRWAALGADNYVLAQIENGRAFRYIDAGIVSLAAVLLHSFEYTFRNQSQDFIVPTLEFALAEILLLHKESLSTIHISESVLSSFPRSSASALGNAERIKGANTREMAGALILTMINLMAMKQYVELAAFGGMSLLSLPTLKKFYENLKKLNSAHQKAADAVLQSVGQEKAMSILETLRESVGVLARFKTLINGFQQGMAGFLTLLSFVSQRIHIGSVNIGTASMLTNIFTSTVSGAIGMQMMAEHAMLARQRLHEVLSHVETQALSLKNLQSWDKHRFSHGSGNVETLGTTLPNTWIMQDFTVVVNNLNEQDKQVYLEKANLTLRKGKIYLLRGSSGEGKTLVMKSAAQTLNHEEDSHLWQTNENGVATNIHENNWGELSQQVAFYEGSDFRSRLSFRQLFFKALFFNKSSKLYNFLEDFQKNGRAGNAISAQSLVIITNGIALLRGSSQVADANSLALRDYILHGSIIEKLSTREYIEATVALETIMRWAIKSQVVTELNLFSDEEFEQLYLKTVNDSMSSGQRARVQAALIMMERPQLILVDELFARVDGSEAESSDPIADGSRSKRAAIAACLTALAHAGHTIILSTHMVIEEQERLFWDASVIGGTIRLKNKSLTLSEVGADRTIRDSGSGELAESRFSNADEFSPQTIEKIKEIVGGRVKELVTAQNAVYHPRRLNGHKRANYQETLKYLNNNHIVLEDYILELEDAIGNNSLFASAEYLFFIVEFSNQIYSQFKNAYILEAQDDWSIALSEYVCTHFIQGKEKIIGKAIGLLHTGSGRDRETVKAFVFQQAVQLLNKLILYLDYFESNFSTKASRSFTAADITKLSSTVQSLAALVRQYEKIGILDASIETELIKGGVEILQEAFSSFGITLNLNQLFTSQTRDRALAELLAQINQLETKDFERNKVTAVATKDVVALESNAVVRAVTLKVRNALIEREEQSMPPISESEINTIFAPILRLAEKIANKNFTNTQHKSEILFWALANNFYTLFNEFCAKSTIENAEGNLAFQKIFVDTFLLKKISIKPYLMYLLDEIHGTDEEKIQVIERQIEIVLDQSISQIVRVLNAIPDDIFGSKVLHYVPLRNIFFALSELCVEINQLSHPLGYRLDISQLMLFHRRANDIEAINIMFTKKLLAGTRLEFDFLKLFDASRSSTQLDVIAVLMR